MCLRIRKLTEAESDARSSVINLLVRDAPGAPMYAVDGVLEWWDGSAWREALFSSDPASAVYSVYLSAPGFDKVGVIKVIRHLTGKGLKEAKDIVDAAGVAMPALVCNCPTEKGAADAMSALRDVGASAYYTARP